MVATSLPHLILDEEGKERMEEHKFQRPNLGSTIENEFSVTEVLNGRNVEALIKLLSKKLYGRERVKFEYGAPDSYFKSFILFFDFQQKIKNDMPQFEKRWLIIT
jgi:hypothetical protein